VITGAMRKSMPLALLKAISLPRSPGSGGREGVRPIPPPRSRRDVVG